MEKSCENIREQIPALVTGTLPAEKAADLQHHIDQCPNCSEYLKALQADDRLFEDFAKTMQPTIARLENEVIDGLNRATSKRAVEPISIRRTVMKSRIVKVAAAALIIIAILVGASILTGPGEETVEIVKQQGESDRGTSELPKQDKADLEAVVEAELDEIRHMVAASDIDGLVAMLKDGQWDSKLAAANYLGRIGDLRALGALEQLSAEWQGDAADNPFADAISKIKGRFEPEEQQSQAGSAGQSKWATEEIAGEGQKAMSAGGVVVDEQGRAVPNARVLLYHNRSRWGLGNRVVEETVSTADGSFVCSKLLEFSSVQEHAYAQDSYILLATHPDYAFGWKNITQRYQRAGCELVLTSPTSQTITVTDHDGNPLTGARVWLYSAGDRKSPNPVFRDYLSLATDIGLIGGKTNADGQVIITNLPQTGCSFHATLNGYATGLSFTGKKPIRLSKGADVSGWLLAEAKEPVEGATVRFGADWMHSYFLAQTDAEGHFHLEDLPAKGWDMSPWGESEGASGSYTVTVEHGSCSAPETHVTLSPGESIDDLLIEAYRETTLVECRVAEVDTNTPLAGVRIGGSNKIGRINGYSDSNGIFSVRVLPGPVSLRFYSPPDGVYVLEDQDPPGARLNFNAKGARMTVTLRTPPIAGYLISVPGIVLGPDGLAQGEGKAVVYAGAGRFHTSTAGSYVRPVGVDSDGRFELKEVPAGRKLYIYAETGDRTLAAVSVFEIPAEPSESVHLEVKLETTQRASAIVVDESGEVIPDMSFSIRPMVDEEQIWPAERTGRTDERGVLEIDGILPGLEYYLYERSDKQPGRLPEGTKEPVKLKMVLAPVKPQ